MVLKWVLLDIGEVIVQSKKVKNLDKEILAKLNNKYKDDFRVMHIGNMYYQYSKELGKKIGWKNALEQLHDDSKFNKELADYLKNKFNIAIFSNNFKENVEVLQRRYKTKNWAKKEFYSCDYGIKKPDARFFQLALKELKAKPQECLLIDDQQHNVDAAKKLGIKAILYTNNKEVMKKIEQN